MNALVGHPMPLSHAAWTRFVLAGSYSCGLTAWNFPGGSRAVSICRSSFDEVSADACPPAMTRLLAASTSRVRTTLFFIIRSLSQENRSRTLHQKAGEV